ncbi:hypothetical protein R1flu_013571 [Riccia fluitans]|uniref:Uncharacterized protein n=1 Tax=Riccia fluitans TaxID=41844 RepID=A0ABD1YED3_9MARC
MEHTTHTASDHEYSTHQSALISRSFYLLLRLVAGSFGLGHLHKYYSIAGASMDGGREVAKVPFRGRDRNWVGWRDIYILRDGELRPHSYIPWLGAAVMLDGGRPTELRQTDFWDTMQEWCLDSCLSSSSSEDGRRSSCSTFVVSQRTHRGCQRIGLSGTFVAFAVSIEDYSLLHRWTPIQSSINLILELACRIRIWNDATSLCYHGGRNEDIQSFSSYRWWPPKL